MSYQLVSEFFNNFLSAWTISCQNFVHQGYQSHKGYERHQYSGNTEKQQEEQQQQVQQQLSNS